MVNFKRLPFYFFLIFIGFGNACNTSSQFFITSFNLVGTPDTLTQSFFDTLSQKGIKQLAFNPYAFTAKEKGEILYNAHWQWYGETPDAMKKQLQYCKKANIEVGITPHLWLRNGEFTGTAIWEQPDSFFASYTNFLVELAQIAEAYHADWFSIGKELNTIFEQYPEHLAQLVSTIRKHYNGPLVYCENWDKYNSFSSWHLFDIIGINAYFPANNSTSLKKTAQELEQFKQQHQKPLWFTEWGFRKSENCLEKPWEYSECTFSENCQKKGIELYSQYFFQTNLVDKHFYWKLFPKVPSRRDSCDYSLLEWN